MSGKMIERIDMLAKCRTYTLNQIKVREPDFEKWEMRNDKIERVVVQQCDHGFLSLGIDFVSNRQSVGYGYRSEKNIGLMILALAKLLDKAGYNCDILEELTGEPIRVLSKFQPGGMIAELTYIGNFMEDKFVKVSELCQVGIVRGKGEQA